VLVLTSESGGASQPIFRFQSRNISVGRKEGNDVVLPVGHISSRHANIKRRGGSYVLSDLGSTNGSAVERGEQRLILGPKGQPEIALQAGDLLLLGDIDDPVRLRVSLPEVELDGVENTIVATRVRKATAEISRQLSGDQTALPVLFSLVAEVNALSERDQILPRVADAALEALPGAVDVLVVIRDVSSGALAVSAEAHQGVGICRVPDQKICEQVLRDQEAVLFGQHDASVMPAHTLISKGVGSGIAAPLWQDQQVLGVLQVNCEPGRMELTERHLDLAAVLAHHAAAAMEKAELIARLRAAEKKLRDENVLLRRQTQPGIKMIAESPAMVAVCDELKRAASSDVTVLLQGETGTGKEVAARFVHAHSARCNDLLVPVNCGALSESLLDSELFGYRKGAFTGASSNRKGVFEMARGGTVFLDEIGETPLSVQVRLLRVLEEGKIKVLGDAVERNVNARIIAASNKDLAKMVEEGTFRQDLYYRLRVFPVTLPPLRERPEDIEPLCRLFMQRYSEQMGKRVQGAEPGVFAAMRGFPFPGNVRELANEIERAVVRMEAGGVLTVDLLSEESQSAGAGGAVVHDGPRPLREQLADLEREIIKKTLARHKGRKVSAAKELGLTRQGLAKKMDRLGI